MWLAFCLPTVRIGGPEATGVTLRRPDGSRNDGDYFPKPTPSLIHHRRPTLYYPPLQNGWAAVMAGPRISHHKPDNSSAHFL
jgi:hypothetical protein